MFQISYIIFCFVDFTPGADFKFFEEFSKSMKVIMVIKESGDTLLFSL